MEADDGRDRTSSWLDKPRDWAFWCAAYMSNVTPPLQERLRTDQKMRQSFADLWRWVAEALRARKIPTYYNLLEKAALTAEPIIGKEFLGEGGRVASVVLCCFGMAILNDEYFGTGEHLAENWDGIRKLPRCKNDGEFPFARVQYGCHEGLDGEAMLEQYVPLDWSICRSLGRETCGV